MPCSVQATPWNVGYTPPEPGEEVVITGISGRFPECDSVTELKEKLMNKVDLVTDNSARWRIDHEDIPRDGGKISGLTKFDALFFGVHYKQAHALDPVCRLLLEHSYEAIIDAGVNPKQIRGTNTGVVVAASQNDFEKTVHFEQDNGLGITGSSKAMLANRISYFLDLHGPSYTIDTACSTSMVAIDQAYRMIRTGTCDQVIVGGANLCLNPLVTLQFMRLGALSKDCRCRSFDENASGYVRSETACVIFLQKAKVAKRIYATMVYTKTNCDGYKERGIAFPASAIQAMLFENFYKECGIPPSCLSFLEAHGTGTSAGDPEELAAIDKVFCKNRSTPLRIGCIKSNLGHTEFASGITSVAKVLIAMETGIIPPNLHFTRPMKGMKCFEERKVEVITEPTPWEGGYVGLSSFGFGGVNAHCLLNSYTKEKVNNGRPSDDLPRLVVGSGRTEEAVESLLNYVESIPVDVEYIRLLHEIHADNISGHLIRGYTLVGSKVSETPPREIRQFPGTKRPIWFVFSGMGSQWAGMGTELMRFPIFLKAIQKCDAVLKPRGVDIFKIITSKDKAMFDNVLNSFVGIAAIQIGLVDLLTSVGIVPDNIIGHSVGELGCAYADGCFTAEQMVLSAYCRGLVSIETELIHGSMAAIGLGYEQIKDMCPPDIEVACHNAADSSTISGPTESIKQFLPKLQAQKIFAKEVACSNIAYHSRYIAEAGPKLLEYLRKVIPDPKPRSPKWVSTSVPRSKWSTPEAQVSSAEYYTNNLLNPVLFAETATMIPSDAITIEIAPHCLLQAILKRSLDSNVTNVALTQRGHRDTVEFFLQGLGKLYNVGLQPQLQNLYPPVSFPVSRGTPMISPLVKWEHTEDWFVPFYVEGQKTASSERLVNIELGNEYFEYIAHHVIDGRTLIPATGYIMLVWESVCAMEGKLCGQLSVVFENIKFERATNITKDSTIPLTIVVQRGSGKFEISEGSTTVASGVVHGTENPAEEMIPAEFLEEIEDEEVLSTKDIYKELKLRGYQYTGPFRGIKSASINAKRGRIAWMKNWAVFMDNIIQMKVLGFDTRALYIPTAIKKLVIDVKAHANAIPDRIEENIEIPVRFYSSHDVLKSGGIEIRELTVNSIQRRKLMEAIVLEEYKFVANRDKAQVTLNEMIVLSTQVALECNMTTSPDFAEVIEADDNVPDEEVLTPAFLKVLAKLPMIRPKMTLAADSQRSQKLLLPESVTTIEPEKLPEDGTVFMVAAYNVLSPKKQNSLDKLILVIMDRGFILTREPTVNNKTYSYIERRGMNVVLEKSFGDETLLLLKKKEKPPNSTEVVYVNNNEFSWLNKVKEILKNEEEKKSDGTVRLVLVAEGDMENGALGFVKCLKRESHGEIVKTVIIQDENAPKFSLNDPFFAKQLDIDISFNILRPQKVWGTYRHLPLAPEKPVLVPHGYANIKVRGDLSTLEWVQGPIQPDVKDENLIKVVYSSLNFRDVMLATGKLMPEAVTTKREHRDYLIGFEFSGIDARGRRVMGFAESRAMSNIVNPTKINVWPVSDEWSLEDAATIPVVYMTVFYALYYCGKLRKGEKILIHAGSGGVGQAAINVALSEGCEVFTTVGTPEKRRFIRETFPSIRDDHIGNSRDTSFEQMVKKLTNGKGVDVVLNSLAEEKLQASVRCLGRRGRFLEIGKFDLAANNQLGMEIFLKEISFQGIMLDNIISGTMTHTQEDVYEFFKTKIHSKAIKPLNRKCFEKHELEAAFRYMAAGKHTGKILIKVGDEKAPLDTPILAYPRFNAIPDKSYVIVGGLGGLGLEMADWLVLRGARNLVFISRGGIKTGYQKERIEIWKSYGVKILIISGRDVSEATDCEFILKTAEKQAPVDGIFNLAILLKDDLCTNLTEKDFEDILKPKASITKQLDQVSRKICPTLRHFVVFSSIITGRGNPGQTNYGMGNAVTERICERRVEEGLPGMAIQWGAVADVGLAADIFDTNKQIVICGTIPQNILSCLEELDKFLMHSRPIVASLVIAEQGLVAGKVRTVLEAVMNIMSIKDLKGISQFTSLSDLGMDSMIAMEIKQTFERDFEVFLTPNNLRALNIAQLIEMSTIDKKKLKKVAKSTTNTEADVKQLIQSIGVPLLDADYCVELPVKCHEKKNKIFLIPGIEGAASIFSTLALKLKSPVICLQTGLREADISIEETADRLLSYVLEGSKGRRDFVIVGYSYGSLIGIELVRRLEARDFVGHLILIDGSPDQTKALKTAHFPARTDAEFQSVLLMTFLSVTNPSAIPEFKLELKECTTWEEKLEKVISHTPEQINKIYNPATLKAICTFFRNRLCILDKYNGNSQTPLRTPITLLKPTVRGVKMSDDAYGLHQVTYGKVTVHEIEGDHVTILDNNKVATVINDEPLDDKEEL